MRPLIAGNWKMHHGPRDAQAFLAAFRVPFEGHDGPRVALFPPAVSLHAVASSPARDARVEVGVQNVHPRPSGAFTGETSAPMAFDAGATLALVGHSERRHVFGETDDDTTAKVAAATAAGLVPVLCVGETLEQRRRGRLEDVLIRQLDAGLAGLSAEAEWVVAYEPVWAIGTGETATARDAAEAHAILAARMEASLGRERAAAVPILYGGSVKPGNAGDLLAAARVDGVLVGGASLDPDAFAAIVGAAVGATGGRE